MMKLLFNCGRWSMSLLFIFWVVSCCCCWFILRWVNFWCWIFCLIVFVFIWGVIGRLFVMLRSSMWMLFGLFVVCWGLIWVMIKCLIKLSSRFRFVKFLFFGSGCRKKLWICGIEFILLFLIVRLVLLWLGLWW